MDHQWTVHGPLMNDRGENHPFTPCGHEGSTDLSGLLVDNINNLETVSGQQKYYPMTSAICHERVGVGVGENSSPPGSIPTRLW